MSTWDGRARAVPVRREIGGGMKTAGLDVVASERTGARMEARALR